MTVTFYRGAYTQLWLRVTANEELGLLSTDYIEDFDGVEGQVTLYHRPTSDTHTVAMFPRPDLTPGTQNDVFEGSADLALLANGEWEVRARVRDTLGNWTILNAVADPLGIERVDTLIVQIMPGTAVKMVVVTPLLTIRGLASVMVTRQAAGAAGAQRVAAVVSTARDAAVVSTARDAAVVSTARDAAVVLVDRDYTRQVGE